MGTAIPIAMPQPVAAGPADAAELRQYYLMTHIGLHERAKDFEKEIIKTRRRYKRELPYRLGEVDEAGLLLTVFLTTADAALLRSMSYGVKYYLFPVVPIVAQ